MSEQARLIYEEAKRNADRAQRDLEDTIKRCREMEDTLDDMELRIIKLEEFRRAEDERHIKYNLHYYMNDMFNERYKEEFGQEMWENDDKCFDDYVEDPPTINDPRYMFWMNFKQKYMKVEVYGNELFDEANIESDEPNGDDTSADMYMNAV